MYLSEFELMAIIEEVLSLHSESKLTGRVSDFLLQDVMDFLATRSQTGKLEVTTEKGVTIFIFFQEGKVAGYCSEKGGHSARSLPRAIKRILGSERSEGASGKPAQEKNQALLEWLFTQDGASFNFFAAKEVPTEAAHPPMSVQEILLNAARNLDEWTRLPEQFRNGDTFFETSVDPKSTEMSLKLIEWRVLYLVQGLGKLSEIWNASPLASRLETSRLLYGLSGAQFIRVAPGAREHLSPYELMERDAGDLFAGVKDGSVERPDISKRTASLMASELDGSTLGLPPETIEEYLTVEDFSVLPYGRVIQFERNGAIGKSTSFHEQLRIGRADDNDMALSDWAVSTVHCLIIRSGDSFLLRDLNSTNGVWVNGKRVSKKYLRGGDNIVIYPFSLRFEIGFEIKRGEGA